MIISADRVLQPG